MPESSRWREPLTSAVRAAIVLPAVFAYADVVIGKPRTALFTAFGSFAMLVMVDFSGPPRRRFVAYLALGCGGVALVALGTVCSAHTWLAVGGMAVVGFAILFAGVVNSGVAAARTAAILAFVLPVTIPAPVPAVSARLAGWALAAAAGIAAPLLWPPRRHATPHRAAARACRSAADALDATLCDDTRCYGTLCGTAPHGAAAGGGQTPVSDQVHAARAAVDRLRRQLRAGSRASTGPTGSVAALAALPGELDWLLSFLPPPAGEPAPEPCHAEYAQAVTAAAAVLRSSATGLGGRDGRPDLDRLDRTREAVTRALADRIPDLPEGPDSRGLPTVLTSTFRVVAISDAARRIAACTLVASGASAPVGDDPTGRPPAVRPVSWPLRALGEVAEANASLRSVWFRNSLRGAVGLAAAVLVARWSGAQQSFWIVLGTLSVLRSNALSTGSSIVRGLLGTAAGIIFGTAVIIGIGTDEAVLWGVLPVAVLLAAYAPRAISFTAGQAAFTVVVLVLFNLIQPTGWTVGLVRIEDVAIGFAVSLGVGVLFWPRGAAPLLRENLAVAYARAADHLVAAARQLVGVGDPALSARAARAAARAAHRLDQVFGQHLAEPSRKGAAAGPAEALVAGAARVWRTAQSLDALDRMAGDSPRLRRCAADLDAEASAVHAWYVALGDSLIRSGVVPPPHTPDPERRRRLLACARDAVAGGDRADPRAALVLLWASQHLDDLRRLESHLHAVSGARDRSTGGLRRLLEGRRPGASFRVRMDPPATAEATRGQGASPNKGDTVIGEG